MISDSQVLDVMRQMMLVAIKLAGPILLASIIVGLVIAIFQAATQIHEQTLTFVPKLLIISIMLLVLGSWMAATMKDFVKYIFDLIVTL